MQKDGLRAPYSFNRDPSSDHYLQMPMFGNYTQLQPSQDRSLRPGHAPYNSASQVPIRKALRNGPNGFATDSYKAPLTADLTSGGAAHNSSRRPVSSVPSSVSDPVTMHLLLETALGDSQHYQILSFEQVESLKKEQSLLSARTEGVKRKLALESRVRDAAQSLNRLYARMPSRTNSTASSPKKQRRSLVIGRNNSNTSVRTGTDTLGQTEDELAGATKRCDELALKLSGLELRGRQIQGQLLRHTAGVLQMGYQGAFKRRSGEALFADGSTTVSDGHVSPSSTHSHADARTEHASSVDPANGFDDRSLYLMPEHLDGLMEVIGIDTVKQTFSRSLSSRCSFARSQGSRAGSRDAIELQDRRLATIEKRVGDLNTRLRELIVQANPERNHTYAEPPQSTTEDPEKLQASFLEEKLDYLDRGLLDFSKEQQNLQQVHKDQEHARQALEARIENVNDKLFSLVAGGEIHNEFTFPIPPRVPHQGFDQHVMYTEEGISMLSRSWEQVVHELRETREALEESQSRMEEHRTQLDASRSELKEHRAQLDKSHSLLEESRVKMITHADESFQYETVLLGLWDTLLAGEEEARDSKLRRRQATLAEDDSTCSPSTGSESSASTREEFSLEGFSAKVQHLCTRATSLAEQHDILKRQIKQQRELNSKSDAEKDAEVVAVREELETLNEQAQQAQHLRDELINANARHAAAETEVDDMRATVLALMNRVEELTQEVKTLEQQQAVGVDEIGAKETQLAELESRVALLIPADHVSNMHARQKMPADTEMKQNRITDVEAARETADQRANTAEAACTQLKAELATVQAETERLQAALTLARADLDGAHRSRQRGADTVANPEAQGELGAHDADLQQDVDVLRQQHATAAQKLQDARERVSMLESELRGTLAEFEDVTRAAVRAETERQGLETAVDALLERCEALEARSADERIQWMGYAAMLGGPRDSNGVRGTDGNRNGGGNGRVMLKETISTMVLKNEFKKMMRESRAESLRMLRAEQDSRRKLEAHLRSLRLSPPHPPQAQPPQPQSPRPQALQHHQPPTHAQNQSPGIAVGASMQPSSTSRRTNGAVSDLESPP
ncbi:Up-regulated during septation-domain-containing protein [Cryomyces antarcticus]